MSRMMLHGLGDCTPQLHCGCLAEPALPDAEPVTTTDLIRATGLTTRQLEHWVKRGWVRPDNPSPGHGHPRTYSPGEAAIVAAMAALVHQGLTPQGAAALANRNPHTARTLAHAIADIRRQP